MMYKRAYQSVSAVIVLLIAGATASQASIVWWSGDSGIAPWDPSMPPEGLYAIAGEASFATYSDGRVNIHDTSQSVKIKVQKTDITVGTSWAYQVELRMNSHSRPTFDWGAGVGMYDGFRSGNLAIARHAVGFSGYNGDSFIDGLYVSLDTTNDYHTYRIVKDQDYVSLYIDTFGAPALTVPYSHLEADTRPYQVTLAGTSNGGVANYDVRSCGFNANGTEVPEPTTVLLLGMASLLILRRQMRLKFRRVGLAHQWPTDSRRGNEGGHGPP